MRRKLGATLAVVGVLGVVGCGGQTDHDREVSAIREVLVEAEEVATAQKANHVPGGNAPEDSPCVSSNPDNLAVEMAGQLEDFKDFVVREITDDLASDELDAFKWCVESVELGQTLEGFSTP